MRLPSLLSGCALTQFVAVPSLCGQLVQVRQDFSTDPGWDHYQNRIVGTEMPSVVQDFGWRRANHTASGPGEIGGLFWRTEPQDPLCSYYGDDVGELTLKDPISFSGTICFTDGMTEAAFFGYFNREYQVQEFDAAWSDTFSPAASSTGITIADSSAVGFDFTPRVTSAGREGVEKACEMFTPERGRRPASEPNCSQVRLGR